MLLDPQRPVATATPYLFEHDERADGEGGEERGDQQHDDAHGDAGVQPGQRRDPATGDRRRQSESGGGTRRGGARARVVRA